MIYLVIYFFFIGENPGPNKRKAEPGAKNKNKINKTQKKIQI